MNYNTLHIFGYGETQLITDTENKKVSSASLTKLQAVVDNVYANKPVGNNADTNYHAINIFNDIAADWIPSNIDQQPFKVQYSDLNSQLITDLILEIQSI